MLTDEAFDGQYMEFIIPAPSIRSKYDFDLCILTHYQHIYNIIKFALENCEGMKFKLHINVKFVKVVGKDIIEKNWHISTQTFIQYFKLLA